jgi:hypothetical protein
MAEARESINLAVQDGDSVVYLAGCVDFDFRCLNAVHAGTWAAFWQPD